jgi:BASS family bile acid:Na+ symporter
MEATLRDILNIVTPLFAISTMLGMGLSLRLHQVVRPLHNVRLVGAALFANFVVVPLAALAIVEVLGVREDIRIGLLLISTAAGAPMVPLLVLIARGNIAIAVSMVALLVVATIFYMPIVLPLMLPGVSVDAVYIGQTLALQLLLPLALGLAVKELFDNVAVKVQPPVRLAGNALLAVLLVLTFGLNLGAVLDLFGSGGILGALLLIASAVAAGYVMGGPRSRTRRGLALTTGQRNVAAAFVVGVGNFADRHEVLALLAVAGLLGMLTMIPLAVLFGVISKRREASASQIVLEASALPDIQEARPQAQRRHWPMWHRKRRAG